jgi:hypothetical protein
MNYQTIHDALQELLMAASAVHTVVTADFPEVRDKIRSWVGEEYSHDPFTRLFEAMGNTEQVLRQMERLP